MTTATDVIARYLRFAGYDVTYVRNYTDIDDKIINRSNEQGVDWKDLAETFIAAHDVDMSSLGVERADVEPRATDYIKEIIAIVKTLVDKGVAYEVGGDVYFEVEKYDGYGKLSKRNLDDLQAGARIDVDERKVNPLDFALWKSSKPDEPAWDSPWGKGRPGWHIECSAMSAAILGQPLDIHGGGKDLIFPHHENEIAQSEAAADKEFVRYWIHNGFVNIDSEKMSKSLGNFFTIREVLEKYRPEVVRFFLLSTHYRSPLDFSDTALENSEAGLRRFANVMHRLQNHVSHENREVNDREKETIKVLENRKKDFVVAMDDDFNTAGAIGQIFLGSTEINSVMEEAISNKIGVSVKLIDVVDDWFKEIGGILGIFNEGLSWGPAFLGIKMAEAHFKVSADLKVEATVIPKEVYKLIDERAKARKEKNWARADEIRDKIALLGFVVQDSAQGPIPVPIGEEK
jgi:cysteinyl-tRNA synthetase